MSLHVFGAIATSHGTAANNRGLTEGNITTLQKLVWNGQVHTTVSAESIRFAFRRRLADEGQPCNRRYDEEHRQNEWSDPGFSAWSGKGSGEAFADDDLLGFMSAEAATEETDGKKAKGTAKVRRAVLEVTRAVSLTPWPGDVTFNAASPGATPSAQKKGSNPVPYGTEMHATRYQYGFALTPARLRVRSRAEIALRALCTLGEVAGNQGRFLFDFSPESVIFRLTHEAAPRVLYAYSSTESGQVGIGDLLRKVKAGDVPARELVVGGAIVELLSAEERAALDGAALSSGVVKACETACARIKEAQA
jgi:CRISPR-associated protein Cst2